MSIYDPPLAWIGNEIKESMIQRTALDLLHTTGWKTFHDRVAWKSDPGWLDVTAVHPVMKRTLFVEVKTDKGKLSDAQREWIEVHERAGNEVFVLRQSNWADFVRLVVPPHMLFGGAPC